MTWDSTGAVSKQPKGMVIQNGAYVGLDCFGTRNQETERFPDAGNWPERLTLGSSRSDILSAHLSTKEMR